MLQASVAASARANSWRQTNKRSHPGGRLPAAGRSGDCLSRGWRRGPGPVPPPPPAARPFRRSVARTRCAVDAAVHGRARGTKARTTRRGRGLGDDARADGYGTAPQAKPNRWGDAATVVNAPAGRARPGARPTTTSNTITRGDATPHDGLVVATPQHPRRIFKSPALNCTQYFCAGCRGIPGFQRSVELL